MGSVVFPILSLDGDVFGMYGRKITAGLRAGTPLHTYLARGYVRLLSRKRFNGWAVRPALTNRTEGLAKAVMDLR